MARTLYHCDDNNRVWRWDGVFWTYMAQLGGAYNPKVKLVIPWRNKLLIVVYGAVAAGWVTVYAYDGSSFVVYGSYNGAPLTNGNVHCSNVVVYKDRLVWTLWAGSTSPYLVSWDGGQGPNGLLHTQLNLPLSSYTAAGTYPNTYPIYAYPHRLVVQNERLYLLPTEVHPPADGGNSNNCGAATGYLQLDDQGVTQQAMWKFIWTGASAGTVAPYTAANITGRWTGGSPPSELDSVPFSMFPYNGNLYMLSMTGLLRQVDRVTGALTTKYDLKTGTSTPLYVGSVTTTGTNAFLGTWNTTMANRHKYLLGGKVIPASGTYAGVEFVVTGVTTTLTPETVTLTGTSRADNVTSMSVATSIACQLWMGFGNSPVSNGNNANASGRGSNYSAINPAVQMLTCEYGGYVYMVVVGQHTNGSGSYPGGFPSFVMKWDGSTSAPTYQRLYINVNQDPDNRGATMALDEDTGTIHVLYRDWLLGAIRHFTIDCTTLAQTDIGPLTPVGAPVSGAEGTMVFGGSDTNLWVPTTPSVEVATPYRDLVNNCNDVFYDICTVDSASATAVVEYNSGAAWVTPTVKSGVGSESLSGLSTGYTYTSPLLYTTDLGSASLADNAAFVAGTALQLAAATSGQYGRIITPAVGVTPKAIHAQFDLYTTSTATNTLKGISFNFGDPTQIAAAGPFAGAAITGANVISVGFAGPGAGTTSYIFAGVNGASNAISINLGTTSNAWGNSIFGINPSTGAWVTLDIWLMWQTDGSLRIRVTLCGTTYEGTIPATSSPPTPSSTWKGALFGATGTSAAVALQVKNFNMRIGHLFTHDLGADLPSFYGYVQYRAKASR